MPTVLPMTRVEAYLAYKAGVIQESDLKPTLKTNFYSGLEHWLAYWCGLCDDYPKDKDNNPKWYTEEEYYVAYLCGIAADYPVNCYRRVGAYLRHIISYRWPQPDKPLTREEYYLSLINSSVVVNPTPSSYIVLNGTTEGPLQLVEIYGDTEQATLSGKNLLAYPYYDTQNSPVTRYDVTWTDMGDGTVKANGTPSGASQFIFFSSQAGLPIQPNTTYTLSGGDKTKGVVLTFDERDAGGTVVATHDNIDTLTFTTNENAHTLTGGPKRYSNSITIDNFICKPQLEKGSTPTSWEQYCGGLPSPNPDFPQDINVVTGEQRVTTTNVNMLAIADTTITPAAGGTIVCDDGTVYVSGTNVGQSASPLTNYMDCRAGNTYTLSANASMANSGVIIRLYRSGGPSRAVQLTTADAHGSFTFTEDEKVRLEIRLANGTSFAEGFYLKPQLEIGSEPTPYQKHRVQVHNINLGKNICSETKLTGSNAQIWFRLPKLNSGDIVLSAVLSETTFANTVSLVIDGVGENIGTVTATAGVRFGLPLALTDAQVQAANQSSDAWIRIYKSGANFSGSDRPQIEYGTSVTSYAPYFTPIELCKIGTYQDYIRKSTGKNLFDVDRTVGVPSDTAYSGSTKRTFNYSEYVVGLTILNVYSPSSVVSYSVSNGSITVKNNATGYGLGFPIKVKANTTYTVSATKTVSDTSDVRAVYYQSDGTTLGYSSTGTATSLTFTTPADCDFIVLLFRPANGVETTYTNVQLEVNSTPTAYEPYGHEWYIHKEIGKVLLTGSEGWSGINSNACFFTSVADIYITDQDVVAEMRSDYYTPTDYLDLYRSEVPYGLGAHNSQPRILIRNKDCADSTAFKTWLSTHNTTVYYPLATATDTVITDATLISQLDALLESSSYAPQTTITLTTPAPNLPALLKVAAYKE